MIVTPRRRRRYRYSCCEVSQKQKVRREFIFSLWKKENQEITKIMESHTTFIRTFQQWGNQKEIINLRRGKVTRQQVQAVVRS